MTQNPYKNPTYIDNPNYINPNYNINKINTNYDLSKNAYQTQYNNNLKINQNYQKDIATSTLLLKYLDKYPIKTDNIIHSKRHLDINNYYIMKYQSEIYILKLIILFCGLALIGCLFFLKGFIL